MTTMIFHLATVQGRNFQWLLGRHSAATPRQLAWFYASLCAMSVAIGTIVWFHGDVRVLALAAFELLVVGAAFLLYARHAGDGERIFLEGESLVVELENAGKLQRTEFRRKSVLVEPKRFDRSLIELSGQGHCIEVGRFVRPEMRPALAREIRMALRGV